MPREKGEYPAINLEHIRNLTDNFGIIQFAQHTRPDKYSGYCLDDNARALLGLVMYYQTKPLASTLNLINTYLKFIKFIQKANGRFYNFVNSNQRLTSEMESEDSYGRAIWALGYIVSTDFLPENIVKKTKTIFNKAIKHAGQIKSPRAIAFTLLGLCYMAAKEEDSPIVNLIKRLADKLIRRYNKTTTKSKDKWLWFEDSLTYSNYKLPEALIRVYQITKDKRYLEVAESSLKFIMTVTFEKEDYFSPIGQDGWYFRDGKRAYFDQQPEDAASAVEALVTAYKTLHKKYYLNKARLAFNWFLGKNHLNQMIYDEATGGCYDGLGKYSINFNQGAESTISYFLARLAIEKTK